MPNLNHASQPTTSVVELQVQPAYHNKREWLDIFANRAAEAHQGEPNTSAFATAVNLEEPNNLLLFERYTPPAPRQAHTDLNQVMSAQFVDLDNFGFWSRVGATPTKASRLTLLGLRFHKPEMQMRWLAMVREHALYCQEQEEPTLIYAAGLASNTAKQVIDISDGDLIVVMLSADEAGVAVHQNDARHLQLQAAFAAEGIERDVMFMRRYQVTGDGYWWR